MCGGGGGCALCRHVCGEIVKESSQLKLDTLLGSDSGSGSDCTKTVAPTVQLGARPTRPSSVVLESRTQHHRHPHQAQCQCQCHHLYHHQLL